MAYRALNGLTGSFAKEKLTVSSTSKALTSSTYDISELGNNGNQVRRKIAEFALISVETDQIRFWTNGSDPTTTDGHLMNVGDTLKLESADDIKNFRAIRVTTDATIQVSYA